MRPINRSQLVKKTLAAAKKLKGQNKLADECGVSACYINEFIKGHKQNPPARLLAYLGYKQKVTYERIY